MKLLDRVRHALRVRHFSYRTEQAYVYWIVCFIRFHGVRHPDTMDAPEVQAFLTYLHVLKIDIGRIDSVRPRRAARPYAEAVPTAAGTTKEV